MPDNFHHELESFLEKQLDRTNYWLSFAEAKNAALIAFNVAIIAFIAEFQEDLPIFSTVIMILSVVSTVICLISFIPITNNCTTINTHATAVTPNEQKDNLIFWHDIAKLEVVSRVMRKFDLALAEIYFRGRVHAPWLPSSGQGAKGQGRRYAARLALDAL